ncbi:hypothetical protein BZA05DRAFT_336663 [Tricharina praecox]|uniref:uncharacterized protein n=1 Tax=Tricharina praecox TaxID=43433 RepID=UPI00222074D4|nr:uncharacterized protein BZA05DRAFT_336663 [Tricharina praecox]KAI5853548.1 hypothetical protein BZA05DRAFT_336663 [Tricharina praecox]
MAECLNVLRFHNTRYQKIVREHQGSLEWLWSHEKYQNWSFSDNSSILYIMGKPGSGKSTLVKYFRENLRDREPLTQSACFASFFYSFRDGEYQTSHYSMLRSILYDVLNQNESFFYHFQREFHMYQDMKDGRSEEHRTGWPYESLKQITLSLGDHPRTAERSYFIIDAIDQSDEDDRRRIIELFGELCSKKACIVKVFFGSRPIATLDRYINSPEVIWMQVMNKEDIRAFVDSFLGPNLGFSDDILSRATEYIIENAHGVFLWIRLIKEELLGYSTTGCSKGSIFRFLKRLLTELEGLYERMLGELEGGSCQDITDGIKMFRFVLFGRQPPTILELQHVLAIPDGPNDGVTEESFQDDLVICMDKRIFHCGRNFLEIKGRGDEASVQVMHQTVRDFLLRPDGSAAASRFKIQVNGNHTWICTICIRYLIPFAAYTTPKANSTDIGPGFWELEHFEKYVQYLEGRPLINYRLSFLPIHMQKTNGYCASEECSRLVSMLVGYMAPENPATYLIGDWICTVFARAKLHEANEDHFRDQLL